MSPKVSRFLIAAAAFVAIASPAAAQTKLVFTTMSPAGSSNDKFFSEWAARVNKAANGSIEIVILNGLQRANFGNVYDRVSSNVVQIGWALHSLLPGKFGLTEAGGLPFVSDESEAGSVALWRLYQTGMLNSDFSDVVPIWVSNFPAYRVHFAKPPRTTENLQGLKIAAQGRISGTLIEKLGGNPVSMIGSDVYEALQRGTVDGSAITWAAFAPYKLHEVTSFTVEAPFGSATASWFMTRKMFDSLPPEGRNALMNESGEKQSRAIGKFFDDTQEEMRSIAQKSGKHQVKRLDAATYKQWSDLANGVNEQWAKERPSASEVLAKYRQLLADVRAGK
jgi:TRAP-type transport system periplasmic protein